METYVSTETITLTFPGDVEKTFTAKRVCVGAEPEPESEPGSEE